MFDDRITSTILTTDRLTAGVHQVQGRADGEPVVFVHGHVSSSTFFFDQLVRLPARFRPVAVDLRGFGTSQALPVDASRGLSDFADDVWSVIDGLGLDVAHLLGWSMGGGVVQQMTIDRPSAVTSLTLVNPVSPFGFGGTFGVDGRLVSPEGAGSGGGTANPEFVAALQAGDNGTDSASSPRAVLRAFYVGPDWDREHEKDYVDSMLSTVVDPGNYPGGSVPTQTWPGVGPGDTGVLNTMAPNRLDLSEFVDVEPRPPVLWIRGEQDQIVSDTSMFDLANLGALGLFPGYPGPDVVTPQPMWKQTRSILDAYAAAGGQYSEVPFAGSGHSPHIEQPDLFATTLATFLVG